jgi:hypothetical protein
VALSLPSEFDKSAEVGKEYKQTNFDSKRRVHGFASLSKFNIKLKTKKRLIQEWI